ncbi:MAG: hypothetical protein A2158_00780 [Chloroflexi bacterium RBG_13_46_14]|nr:MAG: hypothetical protein A2158_00780 [Chloroflexi bacterium RBG_13_46_14]
MKHSFVKAITAVLLLTVLFPVVSCSDTVEDAGAEIMSPAEKASGIIGLPVPLPEYLPDGYEIRSIDVEGDAVHRFWDISVLISDSEDLDSSNNISMDIHWFYPGLKPIDVEKVAESMTQVAPFSGSWLD